MATTSIKTIKNRQSHYLPESDGKPMAETDVHRQQMIDLLDCLSEYFRDNPQVYVTGNIFLYLPKDPQTGEQQSVAPDVFVVKGIEKKLRRIYNMEVEQKAPDVVIELISRSSRFDDLGTKRAIYADLGVLEYFIFDPLKEALPTQLHGLMFNGKDYKPMTGDRLHSEVLGLDLVVEDGVLRLYEHHSGQRLRTHAEAEADRRQAELRANEASLAQRIAENARQAAEKKAATEAEARRKAEAELARLKKEIEMLRKRGK